MRSFIGIALITAREAVRQPAMLLMEVVAVTFISALPFLITHILGDPARMIRDSAMALQLMAGMLLGCQAASLTMSREIQKGTLSAMLSTPVQRHVFIAAKFAGLALVMLLYTVTTTAATLLALQSAGQPIVSGWTGSEASLLAVALALVIAGFLNFKLRASFGESGCLALAATLLIALAFIAMRNQAASIPGQPIAWSVLPVCANIGLAISLLTAIAVALSIRAGFVPVLLTITGILMAGLMSDYVFGRRAGGNTGAAMLHAVIPNWQHFWTVDALHLGTMSWAYSGYVALYTACYITLVIAAGSLMLARLEMKK